MDLKDKVIHQNQEDVKVLKKKLVEKEKVMLDLKEKINENGVQKKSYSSISVQTDEIPKECSSSRNPSFHPDEYRSSSCNDKAYAYKLQYEKPQVDYTRKALSNHVTIVKLPTPSSSSHTAKISHDVKPYQVVKTPFHLVKIHAPSLTQNIIRAQVGKCSDVCY